MAKASLAVPAENTWSDKFHLSGDGAGWGRRALVLATRDDSTVTLRRYNAAGDTVLASIDMDSVMTAVEVPVPGLYDVGVAAGNYGGAEAIMDVLEYDQDMIGQHVVRGYFAAKASLMSAAAVDDVMLVELVK